MRVWMVSLILLVSATSSSSPSTPAYPRSELVAVLTEPDRGPQGRTTRWSESEVTYRIDLPGYPELLREEVDQALAWASTHAGVRLLPVKDNPMLTIVRMKGNGAFTTANVESGRIVSATVRLGCCRKRPVWEDVLQSFGPMGDRASAGLFSQNHEAEHPGQFEAEVFHVLYSLPPGSTADEVQNGLDGSSSP